MCLPVVALVSGFLIPLHYREAVAEHPCLHFSLSSEVQVIATSCDLFLAFRTKAKLPLICPTNISCPACALAVWLPSRLPAELKKMLVVEGMPVPCQKPVPLSMNQSFSFLLPSVVISSCFA